LRSGLKPCIDLTEFDDDLYIAAASGSHIVIARTIT